MFNSLFIFNISMALAIMKVNWQYMQINFAILQYIYRGKAEVVWNALKIFLAIADSGTLAGAAKALEVNHSTVFRRLNTFENEIGGACLSALTRVINSPAWVTNCW
ncbi:MAG: LysR family transcriptional regulator [Woeseiaceae bacterium]